MPATATYADELMTEYLSDYATVYLALVTTVPSATVAGTEVDDDDYERLEVTQSTDWDDDEAGTLTSNTAFAWPEAADDFSDDVEAIECYDAATDGNRLWYQTLSAPVTYYAGEVPTFPAGAITFSYV